MTHAQKPDFVFRRNGRVHINQRRRQFSQLPAAEVCTSALVMLDTPSSDVVKGTGYPLHSPVSPSLPLLCITVCHQVSNTLYYTVLWTILSKLLLRWLFQFFIQLIILYFIFIRITMHIYSLICNYYRLSQASTSWKRQRMMDDHNIIANFQEFFILHYTRMLNVLTGLY